MRKRERDRFHRNSNTRVWLSMQPPGAAEPHPTPNIPAAPHESHCRAPQVVEAWVVSTWRDGGLCAYSTGPELAKGQLFFFHGAPRVVMACVNTARGRSYRRCRQGGEHTAKLQKSHLFQNQMEYARTAASRRFVFPPLSNCFPSASGAWSWRIPSHRRCALFTRTLASRPGTTRQTYSCRRSRAVFCSLSHIRKHRAQSF